MITYRATLDVPEASVSRGTLIEPQTDYAMLLHLPEGYKPEQVRDALAAKIETLPQSLRLSLTWDPRDARLEACLGR